jgi:Carbohydrate-selective porin, OprB family
VRASLSALVIFGAAMLGSISEPATADEGLFQRDRLTGDWGGVRKQWEDAGVAFGATDVSETLSNPTGGIRQLTIYQGLLDVSLNLDLEKLAKWPDATFYIDGYWISGRGLSRDAVGNLLAVSSIEALTSTRLHDMWFQQEFPRPPDLATRRPNRSRRRVLHQPILGRFRQLDVRVSGHLVDRPAERGTLLSLRGSGRARPGRANDGFDLLCRSL